MRMTPRLLCALLLGFACGTSYAGPSSKGRIPAIEYAPSQIIAAEPNDQCSGAILLTCGNINLSGTTAFAANNYTFTDSATSCTGYLEEGRDLVYLVNVAAGDSIWLDYDNTVDGAIYIVTDCGNVQGTCVAGVDDALEPTDPEFLRYKFATGGLYYVILDSYGENTGGTFTLNGQLICSTPTPPANDICQGATNLACGAFNLGGSTQYATDNYTFPSDAASCTGSKADGRDVVYRMTVQTGDSLTISYTSSTNGSVYIIANCADAAGSCLIGVDATGAGQAESFVYRFEFSGVYYLVLDSRDPGTFGTWTATGSLACVSPPPENDVCAGATTLYCGAFNFTGSTTTANNDYSFAADDSSCTGYKADGRDVVYRLDVSAGDSLWVEYHSTSDGSIYLVNSCSSPTLTCIYGVDENATGETEHFRYRFPTHGTYYLVLDSFALLSSGTWTAYGERTCNGVGVGDGPAAARLELDQIQPNPFAGRARIGFALPTRSKVSLRVYDLLGRQVRTLVDGELEAGRHEASWDGRGEGGKHLGPGVYFVRASSGGVEAMRRIVLAR